MNAAHVHLLSNHVPVLGLVFGLPLLLTGLVQRSDALKKAALVVLTVAGLAAGPVYLSGEPAEEVVESLAGTSEPAIEAHEDSAVLSLVAAGVLSIVALTGWWLLRRGRPAARHFVMASVALGLVAVMLMARTAYLGGQIRHSEIRANGPAPADQTGDREGGDDDRGRP